MPVGVTSFISASLAGGARFSIGGRLCAKAGLRIGRTTDMLVRRAHLEGLVLSPAKPSHARALRFFHTMAKNGITVSDVQVRALDDALGIRTELDAVGVDRAGRRVAIELKTTQHSMAEFSAAYYRPCRNRPTLTNRLPNCLYWRHQLQAGFGVIASPCVRGVVAVMCSDGGLTYEVQPAAMARSAFAGSLGVCRPDLHAPVLPYPANADAALRRALAARLKYTAIVSENPTVVRGAHGDAVLVLVHKGEGYSGTRAARGHREYARVLGRRHGCAVVIGWLAEGRWRFQTAVKRRAPAAV